MKLEYMYMNYSITKLWTFNNLWLPTFKDTFHTNLIRHTYTHMSRREIHY